MRFLILIVVALSSWAKAGDALAPASFLVGEWRGEGRHPYGAYREIQSVPRGLGNAVLEDLRVISRDGQAKTLRMRPWTHGVLRRAGPTGSAAVD